MRLLRYAGGADNVVFKVVDPRKSNLDYVPGLGPADYAVLEADRPVAKLAQIPAEGINPTGFLGTLTSVVNSDPSAFHPSAFILHP